MTDSTVLLRLCRDSAVDWAERAGFYGREVSDRQRELRNRVVVLQARIYYEDMQAAPYRMAGLRVERDLCIDEFRRLDATRQDNIVEPGVWHNRWTGATYTPTMSASAIYSSFPSEVRGTFPDHPIEEEIKPVVVEWDVEYVFDKDEYVVSVVMQHGDEFDVTWAHIPAIDVADGRWEEHGLPEEVIRGLKELRALRYPRGETRCDGIIDAPRSVRSA